MPGRIFDVILLSYVLLALSGCHTFSNTAAPDYLNLLSASISEVPPIDYSAKGRKIRFTLELGAAPPCNEDYRQLQYGFLLDADRNNMTGTTAPAFGNLGVDALISVTCDEASGQYISNIGKVNLQTLNNKAIMNIDIAAEELPSVNFLFAAFSGDADNFVRLPEASEVAGWAIHEIRNY